jgi:hypothetical protein
MKLLLKHVALKDHYTIGKLYCNGRCFCDTLEDTVRVLGKNGEGKIFGETAIPEGTYKIVITYSQRFKCKLPLLVDVPFFTGIRIHAGNSASDTHGCILVGINDVAGMLHKSKSILNELIENLETETENEIEII